MPRVRRARDRPHARGRAAPRDARVAAIGGGGARDAAPRARLRALRRVRACVQYTVRLRSRPVLHQAQPDVQPRGRVGRVPRRGPRSARSAPAPERDGRGDRSWRRLVPVRARGAPQRRALRGLRSARRGASVGARRAPARDRRRGDDPRARREPARRAARARAPRAAARDPPARGVRGGREARGDRASSSRFSTWGMCSSMVRRSLRSASSAWPARCAARRGCSGRCTGRRRSRRW